MLPFCLLLARVLH
uniref:Uncharacterized protein n=1 Tax=Arundo donax TaxID=35708 RepID=A0A0A9HQB7_ARUDO